MADALTYSALHAIGLASGAALCVLLGLMQIRVDRVAGSSSGYQLLWVVGFFWTFGSFLQHTLQLAGVGADATSVRLAEVLAWSSTVLGPIAIGRFLEAGIGTTNRASRMFRVLTRAVALLNLSLLIWASTSHESQLGSSWYPEASFYVALVLNAIALVLYRAHRRAVTAEPGTSKLHWFGRGMILLAALQVTAALLSLQSSWLPQGLHSAVTLISEHWAIPWSILIAVSLAQIHYADLVLKRSLWLLAVVSIAALVSMFVFQVPPGWPMVASTLGCASLLLSAPLLLRALNFLVDRIFLHRPDYVVAARDFEDSVRRVSDQKQLLDIALQTVRSTLHLDARCVPAGADEAPPMRARTTIQIKKANLPCYRLEVSPSHHARALMQQEFAFLNAIGAHVSRRLDAIHFEQEQGAHHLREERLSRLLTEAELKALRTQVDPHFLFNTLNTIADLTSSNPLQAEEMIGRLAECFRYALSRHSHDLATLDDELEFARHYLDIEQVRFGDRLRVQLSRGNARGSEAVPSLLLQPLLENAIRHGLAPIRSGGCISVIAKLEGEYLRLQVEDDGVGLRPDFNERRGIGLQNVKDRLHALYSEAGTLVIDSGPDQRGTSVTIRVPLRGN